MTLIDETTDYVIRETKGEFQHSRHYGSGTTKTQYELATQNSRLSFPTLGAARAAAKKLKSCEHKGVAYYDRQRMNRKLPKLRENERLRRPDSIHFPGHVWDDDANDGAGDFVPVRDTVDDALHAVERGGAVAITGPVLTELRWRGLGGKLRKYQYVAATEDRLYSRRAQPSPEVFAVALNTWRDSHNQAWCRFDRDPEDVRPDYPLTWQGGSGKYRAAHPEGGEISIVRVGSSWCAYLPDNDRRVWADCQEKSLRDCKDSVERRLLTREWADKQNEKLDAEWAELIQPAESEAAA